MGLLGLILKFFGEVIWGILGIIVNFLGGILYVVGWIAIHLIYRILSMEIFDMTASQFFFRFLSLELSALPVLGAVLLVRWLLKKTPRRAVCLLWMVLWLRLLVPFTIEVPWGLTARPDTLEEPAAASMEVSLPDTLDAAQQSVGDALAGGPGTIWVQTEEPPAGGGETDGTEDAGVPLTRGEVWLLVCTRIWEAGMAAMFLYSAVSLIRLRRRLAGAVRLERNVYLSDRAGTPFVLGLLRPKIYLPSDLPEEDRELILRHERAHIRSRHHQWKPLAFLALAVHWFNPLVWLAFYLFVCDLEVACDEAATAELDREGRADYAAALLRLSAPMPRRAVLSAPLAFGEGDPKGRIMRVLTFRRPAARVAAAAVVLAALLGGLLFTSRNAAEYPLGAEYRVEKWAFTSFVPQFYWDPPEIIVSGDYHLWIADDRWRKGKLTDQGQLESCHLTRRELLSCCNGGDFDKYWQGDRPGQIAQAWRMQNGGYMLFRTTDGDTWLAYGTGDPSEWGLFGEGVFGEGRPNVHWIAKLERDTEASLGRYFSKDEALALGSGINATMRGTLECGEKTSAYVDYWYSPDSGAGFAVYEGGDRGVLLARDRSEFVQRTQLYDFSADELTAPTGGMTEVAAGSGVYTLPLGLSLEYDGKNETRTPVLCLNENIRDIQRTATRADGTVLSQERDSVMGRGVVFFTALPDTAGQEVTVTYQLYNDLGNEIFYDGEGLEQTDTSGSWTMDGQGPERASTFDFWAVDGQAPDGTPYSLSDGEFLYGSTEYDRQTLIQRLRDVNIGKMTGLKPVGQYIVLEVDYGTKYYVFDTETQGFIKRFPGTCLVWQGDDLHTAVYASEDQVFTYDGDLLADLELEDGAYIRDLAFTSGGTQLQVTAELPSGERRTAAVDLSAPRPGAAVEPAAPTEAQVLALREQVEAGMTEEETARLHDIMFAANNWFEHEYFYNDLFDHLSDPEDLYWNYFEQTGEIQIGWAVSGSIDQAAVREREGLTEKEFYEKYGTGVVTTNDHTLDDFIAVLEELKGSVKSGLLDSDLDRMKDLCAQAKETHDYLYVNELFRMLHDMEYFLLRYGITDVGPYVSDTSWLSTYFGSLSVWQDAAALNI